MSKKSKSKKGRKRRKNKNKLTSTTQEDSTQGEYAYFRLARSAEGGVAPRRNTIITESATKA